MKLLVTGGAGYIGSVVANQLLERGHEVAVLDDLSRGHRAAVPSGARFLEVGLADAGGTRDALDERLQPFASRLKISMELESTELIKSFAAAGLGIGFVAQTMAVTEARSGELALLPLAAPKLYRELGLVFRRDRALGRAALAFIDMAIQASNVAPGRRGSDGEPPPA